MNYREIDAMRVNDACDRVLGVIYEKLIENVSKYPLNTHYHRSIKNELYTIYYENEQPLKKLKEFCQYKSDIIPSTVFIDQDTFNMLKEYL